jgi:acetyl esterase/lipase
VRLKHETPVIVAMLIGVATVAHAQVPPQIAKQLVAIGRGVCPAETAQLYLPLHARPPYHGVSIARDISTGPDPKNVVDVFTSEQSGGTRPVLIYVPGGPGNRHLDVPGNDVFYDNVMLWAVRNGMVGVLMQRRPGNAWDDPAKDIAKVVQWVDQNVARYKGNSARVFLWAQSAGNVPTGTYVGHPELYGPKGVGLKGVIFMSPATFNILPAAPPRSGPNPPCGPQPASAPAPAQAPAAGPGRSAQPDAATQLARSNLPGLVSSRVPFLITTAELDPPSIIAFAETLKDQLCKAGRCPMYLVFKDHSHISEVMSPNTADDSVTGPILTWIRSIK